MQKQDSHTKLPTLAQRSTRISSAGAIQALSRARELEAQGVDIIHLEIGELDFDTPDHIVAAGSMAMRSGRTRYAPTAGSAELRSAVADYVSTTRGTAVDPAQVIATLGVKGALYATIMTLIDAGDEVIVPNPGFTAYNAIVAYAGGRSVSLPLRAANHFQPDSDELRSLITPRTKLLILNSPSNPTGAVFSQTTLQAIAKIALEYNLWVISDEIYHQLAFSEQAPPSIYALPEMAERTILMDGFSKAYAMTGWRLGFGVFPAPLIAPVLALIVNDSSCLPLFVMDAGVAALRGDQSGVGVIREELRQRRDLVVAGLNQLAGVACPQPEAAFYALLDISALRGISSTQLVDQLLEVGVSLLPGGVFGSYGEQYVRLAYTVSQTRLSEALQRIASAWPYLLK